MAKRNLSSAGGSTPPTKKDKPSEVCVSCKKQISENSHSLFCECCSEWEHRNCSGVSSEVYDLLSNDPCPNIMFFCSLCRPKVTLALKFFNEVQDKHAQLEARLAQLEKKLAQPNDDNSASVTPGKLVEVINDSPLHGTNKQLPTHPQGAIIPPKPPQMVSDRKFNVVIYGIKESPPNTPKATRLNCDLENLHRTLSNMDSSLNTSCIQDFHRLGKFNATNSKPRPLLVKFLRAFDATLVLSKRGSPPSSILVKPDLTREERAIDSAFLKTRWNLIQSGTDKKYIRLRGTNIYINKQLYARLDKSKDGSFVVNIIDTNLPTPSYSQDTTHSNSTSIPTHTQHSTTSNSNNPEPMITAASSASNNNQ